MKRAEIFSEVHMKMSNVKKSLCLFLRGSRGFSLAEIMVAAGMLGIISVGVMQMMTNMQKGQKSIAITSEREIVLYNVRMALRDKLACERTFANVTVAPLPQNGVIAGNVGGAAAVNIPRIFSGGTVARVIATTLANGDPGIPGTTEDNIYGRGTQGRILLETMQIVEFGAPYPGDNNRNWFKLRLTFLKGGEISTGGAVVDKSSFGGARTSQDFDVQYVVTAAPAAGPSTPNIGECFVEEAQYIDAACTSLGGTVNPSGDCTNLVIRHSPSGPGPVYPLLAIMNLGDVQVTRGLVVGDGTNNNTVGTYLTPTVMVGTLGGIGVGENSTGEGNLDVRNRLSVGSTYTGTAMTGGVAAGGNLALEGSLGIGTQTLKAGAGHINFTGDLSGAGSGYFGQRITGNNFVDILDGGKVAGGLFLKVGDDSFLTDVDVANTLGIYGATSTDRVTLQLGSTAGQGITGRSGVIGIDRTNPAFDAGGSNSTGAGAQTDVKLDVNGSIHWGGTYSVLSSDQGGSIELGRNGAYTPYIDFKNNNIDYDARIILATGTAGKGDAEVVTNSDALSIQGGYLFAPEGAAWGGGGPNGTSYRVATRKFIENLLAANIDDTKWSNMMQDISEAVTGLALDEGNILEAIADFVCRSIRVTRGLASGGAGIAVWNGSTTCTFSDYWDDIQNRTCPTGEYIYSISPGTTTCIQWPVSPEAVPVMAIGSSGGIDYRNWKYCAHMTTGGSGAPTCVIMYIFEYNRNACNVAYGPDWPNQCTAELGGGWSDNDGLGSGVRITNDYDPGGWPQDFGARVMDLRSPGADYSQAWPAMLFTGGVSPCVGSPHFAVWRCIKTATQIDGE